MPSALKEHREKNVKLHDEARLEALAQELDNSPSTEAVTSEELEQDFMSKHPETLDEAVEQFEAANPKRAYNALMGKEADEVRVNLNPRPVNNWGVGKTPVDTSKRIRPDGVYRGPDTSATVKGQVLPHLFVGNYDVVILAPSHRDATTPLLVNAILDRMNPEFVIHGGNNGADAMARTWVLSRLGEGHQAEFLANWDTDGQSAGPIRNGEMLDLGRKLIKDEGKTVALIYFFYPDQFGRDRITDSMLNANAARNAAYQSQPHLRDKFVIPAIDAHAWMEDDSLASNPSDKLGIVEFDLPVPSSVR